MVVDKKLGGLHVYVEDLVQSPFGFLKETMHLAATIAGDGSTLPQVSWLGNDEYTSLAIHGKRVELQELRDLCSALLREAERQMKRKVKMGMSGIRNWNWEQFDAEDDLGDIKDGHSFVTAKDNRCSKQTMALLDGFLSNGITDKHFTRGRAGERILWRRDQCLKWLKETKRLLEKLSVLCHLVGGQPARSVEMATLRVRNSIHEQRGVYWANGRIMLVGLYSKTRGITSKNRVIPRSIF